MPGFWIVQDVHSMIRTTEINIFVWGHWPYSKLRKVRYVLAVCTVANVSSVLQKLVRKKNSLVQSELETKRVEIKNSTSRTYAQASAVLLALLRHVMFHSLGATGKHADIIHQKFLRKIFE